LTQTRARAVNKTAHHVVVRDLSRHRFAFIRAFDLDETARICHSVGTRAEPWQIGVDDETDFPRHLADRLHRTFAHGVFILTSPTGHVIASKCPAHFLIERRRTDVALTLEGGHVDRSCGVRGRHQTCVQMGYSVEVIGTDIGFFCELAPTFANFVPRRRTLFILGFPKQFWHDGVDRQAVDWPGPRGGRR